MIEPMKVRWKVLISKASIWLASEIFLTLVGLDNVADYSEFVLQSKAAGQLSATFANAVTWVAV